MKNYTKILSTSIALALILSFSTPISTFAKQNEIRGNISVKVERKEKDDDKKDEDKKVPNGICKQLEKGRKPYGWFKNWFGKTSTTTIANCIGNATSTPNNNGTTTSNQKPKDTTAPVISDISKFVGNTFAVLSWKTNEKSEDKIYWSTGTVSTSSTNVKTSFRSGNNHFVIITGLSQGTSYNTIIESKDSKGNIGYSSVTSFTTSGTAVDTEAPTISSIVSTAGTSTINVAWQTNEASNSKVYYGTSTPIATSSANFVSSATFTTNHSLQINGLATSTPYFLLVQSADSANNVSVSSQFSTTTLGL